jgi:hypothetical protein
MHARFRKDARLLSWVLLTQVDLLEAHPLTQVVLTCAGRCNGNNLLVDTIITEKSHKPFGALIDGL